MTASESGGSEAQGFRKVAGKPTTTGIVEAFQRGQAIPRLIVETVGLVVSVFRLLAVKARAHPASGAGTRPFAAVPLLAVAPNGLVMGGLLATCMFVAAIGTVAFAATMLLLTPS